MTLLFEPNSLYIILLDLGGACLEWQLYLASTATTGRTFHITNQSDPVAWEYKSEEVNMSLCETFVLALQVGMVGPVLHTALEARLRLVPLTLYSVRCRESLCCRVWVQEALFALDDEGYLNLGKGVKYLEQEAGQLGRLNQSRGIRSVVRSLGFVGSS